MILPHMVNSSLPPSQFSLKTAWSHGLSFEDAMYILYWNHYRQLEAILEAKGFSSVEHQLLKNFKIWQYKEVLKQIETYNRRQYIERIPFEDPVLQWCLINKIPKGGRNWILLKNLAIAIIQLPVPESEKPVLLDKIMDNCKGINDKHSIHSWSRFFRKGKGKNEYNKQEVNKWLKIHKLNHLCYGD